APVRGADGARSAGRADLGGELAIAPGFAKRNALQRFPHFQLKRRALRLELQIERGALAGEVFVELMACLVDDGVAPVLRVRRRAAVARLLEIEADQRLIVADEREDADRAFVVVAEERHGFSPLLAARRQRRIAA